MTKEINIHKQYEYQDGKIILDYIGENIKELSEENFLNNQLDSYFNNLSLINDPVKIITDLRLMLKKYLELNLNITISNKEDELFLSFRKKDLKYVKYIVDNDEEYISVKYDMDNMLKVDSFNKTNSNLLTLGTEKLLEVNNLINKLNTIDIYKRKLTPDIKKICKLYKILYDENPNFSDENITIKMQSLVLLILSIYGMPLKDKFEITRYDDQLIPISSKLSLKLKELIPFGIIDIKDELSYDVPSELITKIMAIKDVIREYSKEDSELDTLIKFNNVFYANNCSIKKPTSTKVEEISLKTSSSIEEINYIFKSINPTVIRKIKVKKK